MKLRAGLPAITVFAGALMGATAALSAQGQSTSLPAPKNLANRHADYDLAAREVMLHIQAAFYLPNDGLYAHSLTQRHPEFMWGNGIMLSALLGAARHDPKTYAPLVTGFFKSMDRYWDAKVKIPGYEPLPTRGGGNDKYYDDNAWIVLACLEAFEMTQDRIYLQRAEETLKFVLSGWDEQQDGGIWWHQGHKGGSKNTCANAPAVVACLRIARVQPPEAAKAAVATAEKIVHWTTDKLELEDGLFADRISVATGQPNRDKLTYNTALMIRAFLGFYRITQDENYLRQAKRAAAASDWFLDKKTNAYRDSVKWSHLLVEADLEMYRATHEEYLLRRAIGNADFQYARWKQDPPDTLIDNASVARMLWLMADTQTSAGQQFWQRMDQP